MHSKVALLLTLSYQFQEEDENKTYLNRGLKFCDIHFSTSLGVYLVVEELAWYLKHFCLSFFQPSRQTYNMTEQAPCMLPCYQTPLTWKQLIQSCVGKRGQNNWPWPKVIIAMTPRTIVGTR